MRNHKEMDLKVTMHAGLPAQPTNFHGLQKLNFVKLHGLHDLEQNWNPAWADWPTPGTELEHCLSWLANILNRVGTLLELIGQHFEQSWNTLACHLPILHIQIQRASGDTNGINVNLPKKFGTELEYYLSWLINIWNIFETPWLAIGQFFTGKFSKLLRLIGQHLEQIRDI